MSKPFKRRGHTPSYRECQDIEDTPPSWPRASSIEAYPLTWTRVTFSIFRATSFVRKMCTHPNSKHLPGKWLTTSPALETDYLHYFLPHPPSPIPLLGIAARYFLCYLVVLRSTSLLFPNLAVRLLIKSATVHTRLVTHICVPG